MNTTHKVIGGLFALVFGVIGVMSASAADTYDPSYIDENVWELSWSEEFNVNGKPSSDNWSYELGKVRNNEWQTYTQNNVECVDGNLIITAKCDGTGDNKYTSSSIITKGKRHFLYGKYIFRARIPVNRGAWPCMWFMGKNYTWPSGGEIDLQEMYWKNINGEGAPVLLCNLCWGGTGDNIYAQKWAMGQKPIAQLDPNGDPYNWASQFHTWVMDWDETSIKMYMDGRLMNSRNLDETLNEMEWGEGTKGKSPFREPQYILLNLPFGGNAGGAFGVDEASMPWTMAVDYVRVYRKKGTNHGLQNDKIDTTPGTGPEYEADTSAPKKIDGYKLCWNDEFNEGTKPSSANWNTDSGSTVAVADGCLKFTSNMSTWGSVNTKGIRAFTNGIFEIRARIPVAAGAQATFWTESLNGSGTPYGYMMFLDSCYISGAPLIALWDQWGTSEDWYDRGLTWWIDGKDAKWAAKFHVWKYVVDDTNVSVYIDDALFYQRARSSMLHGGTCPFGSDTNPHYLGLGLYSNYLEAIFDSKSYPVTFAIDYVRCYIPGEEEGGDDEPEVDPPTEPVEQPTNATMQAWFAYTAANEQVVGGAWQDETEDGVKVFLPTASSKDGDLVYVDVTAKFPAVAVAKLPGSVTAQSALTAADGYLHVYTASGWTKLVNATVAENTEKSYRVEFDYGSENAPRIRVWESGATVYTELKDANGTSWFALTANTFKCFTSLSFSGDGTIGDFIGTSENGPREVVTIEIPSFADADGEVKGGVALRTVGGNSVFSVTIANGKKGAHYTAFVANTLSTDLKDWVAAADSTSPDADGLLTLDVIRDDSPAKFAKIVATPTAVKSGTTLDTLAK